MHRTSSFFIGNVYEGNEPYAFISYSHKDSREVLTAVSGLYEKGLKVWFDEGIEAGSEWPEYLAEHIAKSAVVLAFVSGNFDKSKYCRKELHYATTLNKPIISIYIDDAELSYGLAMELTSIQGFKKKNFDSDEQLIQSISNVRIIDSILDKSKVNKSQNEQLFIADPKDSAVPSEVSDTERFETKPDLKHSGKSVKKSGRRWLVALIIGSSLLALIIGLLILFFVTRSKRNTKPEHPVNDICLEILSEPGEEFTGEITEEMLIGTYCHLYYIFGDDYHDVVTGIMAQYPDMKYVERLTNPRAGTAFHDVGSSVPYYITCKRLIYDSAVNEPDGFSLTNYKLDRKSEWERMYTDLCAIEPESADSYYNRYVDFYNAFYVEMSFYSEDGTGTAGLFHYVYTIEDNVMRCARYNIGENNEVTYYNADESYKLSFIGNTLSIESEDGCKIELIPFHLNRFVHGYSAFYVMEGFLYDPKNAYSDISGMRLEVCMTNENNTEAFADIYFKNDGYTQDAEVEFHSYDYFTISWYAVYHPDTRTTDAEPNTISIRLIGDGTFFIVDEENNTYNYGAKSSEVFKDPVMDLAHK